MNDSILALIGPTASGKESTAIALAGHLPVEILSLDSMKVFRGMDVGTAKASSAHRARVRHHLIDLADPAEPFSTRAWLTAAEITIREVHDRGAVPLFSGGTALYLKALLFGLFEGPSASPELRDRLRALPREELRARLERVDPETAGKVHANDVRRTIRALEVFELTGRPVSELRTEWKTARPAHTVRIAGIRRDRADLYARIDRRVDRMIEAGLLDEVRHLLPILGPVARQALGYKEVADFLTGAIDSLDEAVLILKRRTRQFARRQLTWFKHFDVDWIDAAPDDSAESLAARAEQFLR